MHPELKQERDNFGGMDSPVEDMPGRAVHSIDAMLGYWDRNQRCGFANDAYRGWFGVTPSELKGLAIRELLGPIYELNLPFIRAALAGEKQVFERAIPSPDGTVRHSIATYQPDVHCGAVRGFYAHVADVTRMKLLELELRAAREEADRLATHDHLTGLLNRVGLLDRIQAAMTQGRIHQRLAAVVSIDFDGFEKINGIFGRDIGDVVLQEVARRMKNAAEGMDTVTRLGGDEFLYLATNLDPSNGLERSIHRMRFTVCQPVRYKREIFHPEFYCGVAVFPWHGAKPMELLGKAERALWKAKRRGGAKVGYATP